MDVLSVAAAVRSRTGSIALALAGAVGFLTRFPLGHREGAWTAMTRTPSAMVVVAYPIGVALSAVFALPLPAETVAVFFPVWLLALTGITHLDGLADVGDAAVVHGDVERRRSVLLDTEVGVGSAAAIALVLAGLALAGLGLASVPLAVAAAIVVAAEVGAKLGMVALAGVGPPLWGELGSQMAGATPISLAVATLLAAPAVAVPGVVLGPAAGVAGGVAVLAGLVASLGVGTWGRRRLDGVNGDCFGASNELARVLGLHAGLAMVVAPAVSNDAAIQVLEVVAWTLS